MTYTTNTRKDSPIMGSLFLITHEWETCRDSMVEVVLQRLGETVSILQVWRKDFPMDTQVRTIAAYQGDVHIYAQ